MARLRRWPEFERACDITKPRSKDPDRGCFSAPTRGTTAQAEGLAQAHALFVGGVDGIVGVPGAAVAVGLVGQDQCQADRHMADAEGEQILARCRAERAFGKARQHGLDDRHFLLCELRHDIIGEHPGEIVETMACAAVLPIEPAHRSVGAAHGIGRTGIPFDERGVEHAEKVAEAGNVRVRARDADVVADQGRAIDEGPDPAIRAADHRGVELERGVVGGAVDVEQAVDQRHHGVAVGGGIAVAQQRLGGAHADNVFLKQDQAVEGQRLRYRRIEAVQALEHTGFEDGAGRAVAARDDDAATIIQFEAPGIAALAAGIFDRDGTRAEMVAGQPIIAREVEISVGFLGGGRGCRGGYRCLRRRCLLSERERLLLPQRPGR